MAQASPDAKFIAGGTNLLDLMKLEIEAPAQLIDGGVRRRTGDGVGEAARDPRLDAGDPLAARLDQLAHDLGDTEDYRMQVVVRAQEEEVEAADDIFVTSDDFDPEDLSEGITEDLDEDI